MNTAPTCSVTGWASGTHPTAGSDASTCPGAVDSNYTISYVPGTLTVNQANLVITASSPTITYGATVPAITVVSYASFVNGDGPGSLTTAPTCSVTGWASGTHPTAGSDATTSTGGVDSRYAIRSAPGCLTDLQANLVITASSP